MTNYYQTNSLYEHLDKNSVKRLQFPKGEIWPLVYGVKKSFEPIILVLAVGRKNSKDNLSEVDKQWKLISKVGKKAKVPVCKVEFNTVKVTITHVQFSTAPGNEVVIDLEELKGKFKDYGLPVTNTTIDKAINDMSSSAYQNWQRDSLGNKIVVADLDVYKINAATNSIEGFYELKRSVISLDLWKPFNKDYNNFKLISKLADKCKVVFRIIYNVRKKNPFHDDISIFKVYDVTFNKNLTFSYKGKFLLSDLLKM